VSNLFIQIIKAQLLVLLSFVLCVVANAATAPGTVIYNSANIYYQSATSDINAQVQSNVSSISVGRLYRFTVKNQHNLTVDAGDIVYLPHRIQNTGNSEDSYKVSFATAASDALIGVFEDAPPSTRTDFYGSPIIYLDVNSNGQVDANEPVAHRTVVLQPEQSQDIIITARVSPSLSNGEYQRFNFIVESDYTNKIKQVQNTVTVGYAGNLAIGLTSSPDCQLNVFPGGTIAHAVDAYNVGKRPIESLIYDVDGVNINGIIVEIPITEHTEFSRFGETNAQSIPGINVVKLEGFDQHQWISIDALLPVEIDSASVTHAGLLVDPTVLVNDKIAAFAVQLNVSDSAFITNRVLTNAFVDTNLDRIPEILSTSTCNTLSSLAAANSGGLRFIEPASHVMQSGLVPDLFTDSDFVDADQFYIKRDEQDSYVSFRDGLYLELSLANVNQFGVRTDIAGNRFVVPRWC